MLLDVKLLHRYQRYRFFLTKIPAIVIRTCLLVLRYTFCQFIKKLGCVEGVTPLLTLLIQTINDYETCSRSFPCC